MATATFLQMSFEVKRTLQSEWAAYHQTPNCPTITSSQQTTFCPIAICPSDTYFLTSLFMAPPSLLSANHIPASISYQARQL